MKKYLIVLLAIGLMSFDPPKETMVANFTDQVFLTDIVNIGLKELNINPGTVMIKKVKYNPNDPRLKASVEGSKEMDQYLIRIVKTTKRTSITYIAHELIHLKQMHDGDLTYVDGGKSVIYKGAKYDRSNIPDYLEREWEKEAFELENLLAKKIKNKIYKK